MNINPGDMIEMDRGTLKAQEIYLRDYFAGQAMMGILADSTHKDKGLEILAKACYVMADAMLEARKSG